MTGILAGLLADAQWQARRREVEIPPSLPFLVTDQLRVSGACLDWSEPDVGWVCTAAKGHDGPHAAYTHEKVLCAVWRDDEPRDGANAQRPSDWCAEHGVTVPDDSRAWR